MISKEFDLNKFKAQSSKVSDFLKGKGHDIPKSTLHHALSVMMGERNWNTLESKLKPQNKLEESSSNIFNADNFIFLSTIFKRTDAIKCIQCLFSEPEKYKYFDVNHIYNFSLFSQSMPEYVFTSPLLLAKNFEIKDDTSSKNLFNLPEHRFINVIEKSIIDRDLIGDEIFFKFSYVFNFTDSLKNNVSKILNSILLQCAFSPKNNDYQDCFVHEPLIKINSRGSRVKVSIYAFINPDYAYKETSEINYSLPKFLNKYIYKFDRNGYEENANQYLMTLFDDETIHPEIAMSSLNERQVCFDIFRKN